MNMQLTRGRGTAKRALGQLGCVLTVMALSVASLPAVANEAATAQQVVDQAHATFKSFAADPDMRWFKEHVGQSQGIMIIPELGKGGFIFGATGGSGVLMQRDPKSGLWSYPSFAGMGSVSFGFQAGVEVAEVILLIMTQRGMEAMQSTDFKLGSGFGVSAGPVGGGAAVATTDVYTFSRSKGLWGGVVVDGAGVKALDKRNAAFYGSPVSVTDILVRRTAKNAGADPLRLALVNVAGGGADVVTDYNIATIQNLLNAQGYNAGSADGLMGPNTERAIRQYQQAKGLEVTGRPSAVLQSRLSAN